MSTSPDLPPGPWAPLRPRRLADAVTALAEPLEDAALRAQLRALATVLTSLPVGDVADPARPAHERALERALADEDEAAIIASARALAAIDRRAVQSVDWSAVSGG